MSTDSLLGKNPAHEGQKDAIHVPIMACRVAEKVYPGQEVEFTEARTIRPSRGESIGVVDPFMEGAIHIDQLVYVLIQPGKVNKLRHEWDLEDAPVFPEDDKDDDNEDYDDECRGCY
jgi:hypothetical protein